MVFQFRGDFYHVLPVFSVGETPTASACPQGTQHIASHGILPSRKQTASRERHGMAKWCGIHMDTLQYFMGISLKYHGIGVLDKEILGWTVADFQWLVFKENFCRKPWMLPPEYTRVLQICPSTISGVWSSHHQIGIKLVIPISWA